MSVQKYSNWMKRAASPSSYERPKKKAKPSLTPVQQQAVTREVKRQMNRASEKKVTDVALVPTSINYTGFTGSLLTNLIRGDTDMNNFDGGTIYPQAVELRYRVTSANGAGLWNCVRVMIGQSKLLGTPTPGNVLQTTGSSTAVVSPRLWERMKNYKILYDQVHALNYESNQTEWYKVYLNKGLLPVEYTASGGLSITKGDIFILIISDDAVAPAPSIEYMSRVKFTD